MPTPSDGTAGALSRARILETHWPDIARVERVKRQAAADRQMQTGEGAHSRADTVNSEIKDDERR